MASVVAVYGIPIEDPETAALTRKVLQISGLMAIFRILAVIFSFSYYGGTYVYAPLSGIAFSLLIPACGYYGARDRRRDLLQWFVGCNIFAVISYVWMFYVVLVVASNYCVYSCSNGLLWMYMIFGGVSAILAFLGCHFGRQLMDSTYIVVAQGGYVTAGAPVASTYTQPQAGYDASGAGYQQGGYAAPAEGYKPPV